MRIADPLNARFKYLAHACIIPGFYFIDIETVAVFFALHTLHGFGNTSLNGLHRARHRNTITIVPYKHCQRGHHYAGGIERLPAMPFRSGGIADGAKTYFITVVAQVFEVLQSG